MPVPMDPNWKPVPGECNGCGGKGKRVKWTLAPFEGDIARIKDIPKEKLDPHAFVTPDGKWHERGKMGWWAIVTDEQIPELWERTRDKIIADYQDHLAVVVDCHI